VEKYFYTFPLVKGSTKPFGVYDKDKNKVGEVQRVYSSLFTKISEIFMTGWEVNVVFKDAESKIEIKELFRWSNPQWKILKNGNEIGVLKNIKIFELGDTKELVLHNQVFTIHDEFAATKTTVTNKKGQTVAVIDYKLFDFSRQREITIYDESLPFGLLIGIDYITSLKRK
jgi:hypothetical protein